MEIRKYQKDRDQEKLMKMITDEGSEWSCYTAGASFKKYCAALEASITYVACEGDILCGYCRSINDCGFYIYVCDLLVMPKYRGRNIGQKLMECIYKDYPDLTVYVMSDADKYYQNLGYVREGSIFEVRKPGI